jgi:hypothetical protein
MSRFPVLVAIAAVAAGCEYPSFQFGPGSSGTTSSGTSSSMTTASTTTASGTAGATTTSSTTTSPVCPDHVVVSQLQTRGDGGGTDEFVELYNPTDADVSLGPDWSIVSRTQSDTTDLQRWQGHGGTLPAHGYFLIGGTGYAEIPPRDDGLSSGISDAGRLKLVHVGDGDVDVVCFAYDANTASLVSAFGCPGSPARNPHDDTSNSNVGRGIQRAPRDCTDTGDNSVDFVAKMPCEPKSSASPPVMY